MDDEFGYDKPIKVIMIGPQNAGKTSLSKVLSGKKFGKEYKATVGADFGIIEVQIPTPPSDTQSSSQHTIVTIHLWDTAGQERFKTLAGSYYRNINCCVLVFPLYESAKFRAVELSSILDRLVDVVVDHSPHPLFIVGNKSDLATDENGKKNRNYDEYQGLSTEFFEKKIKELFPENGQAGEAKPRFQSIHYREVSAKSGQGVTQLLEELAVFSYEDNKRGQLNDNSLGSTIRIGNSAQPPDSGACC